MVSFVFLVCYIKDNILKDTFNTSKLFKFDRIFEGNLKICYLLQFITKKKQKYKYL